MQYYLWMLFLWSTPVWAQSDHWNTLKQEFLGLQYQLPQSWYVGGHAPKKACACQAATVNTSPDGHLSMVIAKGESATLEAVWNYHFVPVAAPRGFFDQDHFAFTESISKWVEAPDEVVWRYSAPANPDAHLVVYFWGPPELLEQHRPQLEHILHSIQPL